MFWEGAKSLPTGQGVNTPPRPHPLAAFGRSTVVLYANDVESKSLNYALS